MAPKKSIFRQPNAKHFQLVHRSQRDPLIHDPEAGQHGKSRAELETVLSQSELARDREFNVGEAALYGIHYDDTEYNYMQHLRTVGIQEDNVESILIEAPPSKKNKNKDKMDDLILPQEVLPSGSELPLNYESYQAIPDSITGFQPDMDPHLRQVLRALEEDAFVDDDLEEDFFGELIEGGGRTENDNVQFEFDENGIEGAEDEVGRDDEHGRESRELGWEERFEQFKKNQGKAEQDATSDDEFTSEGGDTIGGLPSISVVGGKGKRRRKGGSDASGYSMSSSSMYRNEALQTLDERFDQIMGKEYSEENDDEAPPVSDETDSDDAPELITSREDFGAMVNEFLYDYEILGRKMKPKLEGDTPTDKLDTIRRALGQDGRVRVIDDDEDNVQDLMAFESTPKEDRWDCETIITTYSNLENHPHIIRVAKSKPVAKISLDPKTGFPLVNGLPSTTNGKTTSRSTNRAEDESDDTETESPAHKHVTISRSRNESKDEKKARKAATKIEQQTRRAEKREMKEKFEAELKNQKRVLANKTQRVKKL
ncbi:Low temperature viability protein [Macrolepiota fuliginosa MF-IS2]|uniref:Low temperature viability protein n=1 Tax=Macrolepiota fuliginosa MF-IS2 TaxID=1400762 RepID=A0A9P5XI85_9AGAR|nr:Low temperature viability protein [Macrolepiota fuliginosa MF-IS2]